MLGHAAAQAEALPARALHVHRPPMACCGHSTVWAGSLDVQGHTLPTAWPRAPAQGASGSFEYDRLPGESHHMGDRCDVCLLHRQPPALDVGEVRL